ncbi:MAG: hemolysin III family protein [Oscillospiraceae bacterium]|nr:hemolysin III family protein [Oscillospiraceae bacterium]
MTRATIKPRYSLGEEIMNAVTHGAGAGLAVAGLVLLLVRADDAWKAVSVALYGASMILLFIMSSLYHALTNPTAKKVFRIFDHSTIFILIAGTYTPFTLVTLRGWVGWTLFGAVWGAAALGIVLNAVGLVKFKKVSMVCYLASGWCVLIALVPLVHRLALAGVLLLLGGGVAYTTGVLFYRAKRIRYMHSVWHLFVLAGVLLHYFCIFLFVL